MSKDRQHVKEKVLEKSIRESVSNLKHAANMSKNSAASYYSPSQQLKISSQKSIINRRKESNGENKIQVKDENSEHISLQNLSTNKTDYKEVKNYSNIENEQKIPEESAIYYQYEVLKEPKHAKQNSSLAASKPSQNTDDQKIRQAAKINEAFVPDDENSDEKNNNESKNASPNLRESIIDSKNKSDLSKTLPIKLMNVRRFSRASDHLKQKNYSRLTSNKINNSTGRVDKTYSTLKNQPKLNRKQIEKEFYEYTLECRKRLNELFADSLSSDSMSNNTPRSSSISDMPIVTSIGIPPNPSNRNGAFSYSNNFNMIKREKNNNKQLSQNNSSIIRYLNASCRTSRNMPSTISKKRTVETEQVWQI
jgi:hypothetical protein